MSTPVKIIVLAETAEAAAALKQFVAESSAGLKTIQNAAKDTGVHLAGMSYYFRSGIDTIRLAAAGGGARAGFYAIDEAIRGLISSGLKLSVLLPVIGGIAAAAGAGYLVWREFTEGEREAEQRAKELAEAFKGLIPLLKQISELQQAGLLSQPSAARFADYLTGKKKLYVDDKGQITENPRREGLVAQTSATPGTLGPTVSWVPGMVPNKIADQTQIQKWVQDQITAGGTLTKEQTEALARLDELEQKAHEETLSQLEKEKASIHDKYEKQRQEIEQTALVAGAKLGDINFANDPKVKAAQAALADTRTAESQDIAAKESELTQKAAQQQAAAENKIRQQYAKEFTTANKQIDDNITNEAAVSSKKREDFYLEEYTERAATALQFYLTGKITEDEYTKAIVDAQTKLYEGQKKYNEELARTAALKAEVARADIEAHIKGIQENPFLTKEEKQRQALPDLYQLQQLNVGRITELQGIASNPSADIGTQLEAQKQIVEVKQQQAALEQQIVTAEFQTGTFAQRWAYNWETNLTQVKNQWGDLATSLSNGAFKIMEQGVAGISHALTAMILGTKNAGQAFKELGVSLLSNFISSILEAVIYAEIAIPILTALGVVSGGTTAAAGAAATSTAILSTLSIVSGLAAGGPVVPGGIHLVGEQGPELFVSEGAGSVIPNAATQALLSDSGRSASATAAAAPTSQPVVVQSVVVNDKQALDEHLKSSSAQHIIVQHILDNKTRIGLPT